MVPLNVACSQVFVYLILLLDATVRIAQDRWCQERALTDLQWSPHHPELVLASYSARGHGLDATASSALHSHGHGHGHSHTDADGLVLVWSVQLKLTVKLKLENGTGLGVSHLFLV